MFNLSTFEAGFIKGAEEQGVTPSFTQGLLKQADDTLAYYTAVINKEAEASGDPLYKEKFARAMLASSRSVNLKNKQAGDSWLTDLLQHPEAHKFLSMVGGKLGANPENAGTVGGAAVGGVGGGLLGLLLGNSLFDDPLMGLSLVGAGGAALGGAYGGKHLGGLSNWFGGANPPSQGSDPVPGFNPEGYNAPAIDKNNPSQTQANPITRPGIDRRALTPERSFANDYARPSGYQPQATMIPKSNTGLALNTPTKPAITTINPGAQAARRFSYKHFFPAV